MEARLRFLCLGLASSLDRERILMDGEIDVVELNPWNLGGDDDAVRPAPDVDRRILRRRNPPLIAERPIYLVLNPTQR